MQSVAEFMCFTISHKSLVFQTMEVIGLGSRTERKSGSLKNTLIARFIEIQGKKECLQISKLELRNKQLKRRRNSEA